MAEQAALWFTHLTCNFMCLPQIDTRLFDASCAAMLSDLLQRGLVDLMRPGGIGVVRLYTGGAASCLV